MYTIAMTPFKFHSLSIANVAANLLSRIIRSEEICVVSAECNLMRAYRCGCVWFDCDKWE